MSFLAAGINYRTASAELLERMAVGDAELPAQLLRLQRRLGETVILSTCNRTEVYTAADNVSEDVARQRLMDALTDMVGQEDEQELRDSAYLYSGDEAIRHVFRVTCGLDSMVVGEHQIVAQVQTSLRAAGESGSVSGPLSRLFHRALRVSRRVREETGIGRNRLTVSSIGVQLVERELGGLENRHVLLVGVGETGKLAARTLRRMGARRLTVAGRNPEKTARIAAELGGDWVELQDVVPAMSEADVVISSTAAAGHVITAEMVRDAISRSETGHLMMLDLAMPRDVEEEAAAVPGATLYGIYDLQAIAEEHREERLEAARQAEDLLETEIGKFKESLTGTGAEPVIRALGARAEAIRQRELERGLKRLQGLDEDERQVIETLTRSMVSKIIADPITFLRSQDDEKAASQLARLFYLDEAEQDDAAGPPRA